MNLLEEQLIIHELSNLKDLELKIHLDVIALMEKGLFFSLEYFYIFESFKRSKLYKISSEEDVDILFPKKALTKLKDIAKSLMITGYYCGLISEKESSFDLAEVERMQEKSFRKMIDACDSWLRGEIRKIQIFSTKNNGYTMIIPSTTGNPDHIFPLMLLLNAQDLAYFSQRAGYARGIISKNKIEDHKKDILNGLNISAHFLRDVPELKDINADNFLDNSQRVLNNHDSILLFIPYYIERWEMYYHLFK